MFRTILLFVFFTFIISNTYSQSIKNYGIKLGAVASNPSWKVGSNSFDGVETKIGADFGFFVDWSLSRNFSLLTEVHYIEKGFRFYEPNLSRSSEISISLSKIEPSNNYLSIPVSLKYSLLNSDVIPYLLGGLRIDFVISKSNVETPRWLYKNINNTDFGGIIGMGFQTKALFGIGTGIEFKYSPSFVKVDSSPMAEIRNRSFEMSLVVFN